MFELTRRNIARNAPSIMCMREEAVKQLATHEALQGDDEALTFFRQ